MPELVGLVMEFIPGGDLFQYLRNHGRLSEDQARWVFQQVLLMPCKACNRSRLHVQSLVHASLPGP